VEEQNFQGNGVLSLAWEQSLTAEPSLGDQDVFHRLLRANDRKALIEADPNGARRF